jgi:hypothetical protein
MILKFINGLCLGKLQIGLLGKKEILAFIFVQLDLAFGV